MRLKHQHISSGFMAILMFVFTAVTFSSCEDTETVDKSGFALHYTSLTDIGPSMTGVIASPSYKGSAPYDFAITGITFGDENEAYTGDCFTIDAAVGSIEVRNTENMADGTYRISVSSMTAGSF